VPLPEITFRAPAVVPPTMLLPGPFTEPIATPNPFPILAAPLASVPM
jgi:hypothetical protein